MKYMFYYTGIIVILFTICCTKKNKESPSNIEPEREIGSIARLHIPSENMNWVYLVYDKKDFGLLTDAYYHEDIEEIKILAKQHKVFRVLQNTHVKIIDTGLGKTKVRIKEKGRAYSDYEGWLPAEHVMPIQIDYALKSVLPKYEILDKVGNYIDVLIPSLNVNTHSDSLEKVARDILKIENVQEISMYKTKEAFKANFNSNYSDQHPNALKDGYLGGIVEGKYYH